jgi:hypothetical protein
MSGGDFDHVFSRVYDFGDELQRKIDNNKIPDKWGDCDNYSDETIAELKKIADEAKILSNKMHAVEWLYSGDYGEHDFMEEIKNACKL